VIKLLGGSDYLQVSTSGSSTSCDYFMDYTDINTNTVVNSGVGQGNTSGTSSFTLVPGPSVNTYTRQVNYISFVNNDTNNPINISVYKGNGSSTVKLANSTLLPNWSMKYQFGVGWQVFNDTGSPVVATSLFAPIELTVSNTYSYGNVSPQLLATIPANKTIYQVEIIVEAIMNGTSPVLTVGDASNYSSLMSSTQNNPAVIGTYYSTPSFQYSNVTPVYLSITPNGSSTGNGLVIIRYQY